MLSSSPSSSYTVVRIGGGGGGGVVLVIPKVREGGMRQLRMSMKNSMEEKEDPSIPTVL